MRKTLVISFTAALLLSSHSLQAQELTRYFLTSHYDELSTALQEIISQEIAPEEIAPEAGDREEVTGDASFQQNLFKHQAPVMSFDQDHGLTYRLLESDKGAALGFFFKTDKSNHTLYDMSGEEMNRISPAAGIQFSFKFDL